MRVTSTQNDAHYSVVTPSQTDIGSADDSDEVIDDYPQAVHIHELLRGCCRLSSQKPHRLYQIRSIITPTSPGLNRIEPPYQR